MRTQSPNLKWTTKRLITQRSRRSVLFKSEEPFSGSKPLPALRSVHRQRPQPLPKSCGVPSSTETVNATLTIMDLEARPIHTCAPGGRTHHCRVIPRCRLLSGYPRMVAGPVGVDPRAIRRGSFGCRFTTATASSREIMPPVGKSRINSPAMRGPPPAVGG